MIAALYVMPDGPYANLPGVDAWDEARDARRYRGPWPVVAHPPCSRWCQLAFINQKRYGHKVGDDGGCFASALDSVRTYSGVLEHPARTYAWPRFDLPPPRLGKWILGSGGHVTEVAQVAYGHRARKLTWLYYVGSPPPATAELGHSRSHGASFVLQEPRKLAIAEAFKTGSFDHADSVSRPTSVACAKFQGGSVTRETKQELMETAGMFLLAAIVLAVAFLVTACGTIPPIEKIIPNGVVCKARITMPDGTVRVLEGVTSENLESRIRAITREQTVDVSKVHIYDCRNAEAKP